MQATKSVKRNHRKSEVVLLTILEYFIRNIFACRRCYVAVKTPILTL